MDATAFGLPTPPIDAAVTAWDGTVAAWVAAISTLVAVAAALHALRDWRRSASPILILILLGGGLANVVEPFIDILCACWHPAIGQARFFELMGRPMPLWLFPVYLAYFGAQTMATFVALRLGLSSRAMWRWFLIPIVTGTVLEESALSLSDSLYFYYGNQPLRLFEFPLWGAYINTVGVYLGAAALTIAAPYLRGWRLCLVPLFPPLSYAAGASLVGFPTFVVINSDLPEAVTQLGGIATVLLSFAFARACIALLAADSPVNIRSASRPPAVA